MASVEVLSKKSMAVISRPSMKLVEAGAGIPPNDGCHTYIQATNVHS